MFHSQAASDGCEYSGEKNKKKKERTLLDKTQLVLKLSMAFNSFQLKWKRELRACITEAWRVLRAVRNGAQALWLQAAHTKGGTKKSSCRDVKDCAGTISAEGFFMALSKFWHKMDKTSACKQSRPFIYFIQRMQVVQDNLWGENVKKNSDMSSKSKSTTSRQRRVKGKHYPGWLIPTKGLTG